MTNSHTLTPFYALFFLLLHFHVSAGKDAPASSDNLIHSSCVHAIYPDICVRTLSSYPDPPKTPRELAQAAVKVSSSHSKKLFNLLKQQKAKKKREKAALKDCLEQISDSIYELQKTLSELDHLKERSFGFQLSNAETWVSAALTNDETCLDGLKEASGKGKQGKVKEDVGNRVVEVAKMTSNALYLINQLDAKRG